MDNVAIAGMTTDWHLGAGNADIDGIERFLNKMKKKNMPWIHGGDLLEAILPKDRRFSVDEQPMSLRAAKAEALSLLKIASKTCIGIIEGNHEETVGKDTGSVTVELAAALGINPLASRSFVRFGHTLAHFCHYQPGVTRSKVGPIERIQVNTTLSLRNAFRKIDAHVCGMGHIHRGLVSAPAFEQKFTCTKNREIKEVYRSDDPKWVFSCPSMYKVYKKGPVSGYAEAMGVPPTTLGWMELHFNLEEPGLVKIDQYDQNGDLKYEYLPTFCE